MSWNYHIWNEMQNDLFQKKEKLKEEKIKLDSTRKTFMADRKILIDEHNKLWNLCHNGKQTKDQRKHLKNEMIKVCCKIVALDEKLTKLIGGDKNG